MTAPLVSKPEAEMRAYLTQDDITRLHGAAHSGAMIGGDAAYDGCLKIEGLLAELVQRGPHAQQANEPRPSFTGAQPLPGMVARNPAPDAAPPGLIGTFYSGKVGAVSPQQADAQQANTPGGVPLADHDEISRLVLSQPWEIQKQVVTIAAHCLALVDGESAVDDLAGCISQCCLDLAKALSTAPQKVETPSAVLLEIAAERKRQVEVEGWTSIHDDGHGKGEMAAAAACYALAACPETESFSARFMTYWPCERMRAVLTEIASLKLTGGAAANAAAAVVWGDQLSDDEKRDHAERAMGDAHPQKGQDDWQLIETAPHETRVLLGWRQNDGNWFCETGMASHGWTRFGVSNMSRHGFATHWQPIPDAPPRLQEEGK